MSELSPSGGSEGYEACDDAVNVGDDGYVAKLFILHIFFISFAWKNHELKWRKQCVPRL